MAGVGAALVDPAITGQPQLDALRSAAASRGVELSIYPARGAKDIGAAVNTAQAAGATARNVLASPDLNANHKIILGWKGRLRPPPLGINGQGGRRKAAGPPTAHA